MPYAASIAMGIAVAAAGVGAGGLACPAAAQAVLERKKAKIRAYWDKRVAQYRDFVAENGREPERADGDLGAALAIWADDARSQAKAGKLSRERAEELAGVSPSFRAEAPEADGLPAEEDVYRRYEGPVGPAARISCTGFMTVSLALVAELSPSLPYAACAIATLALAAVIALTDWKAHVIPFELSYALVPAGAACQVALLLAGGTTALSVAIGAAAYLAIMLGASWITGKATRRRALGAGDVRSMPGMALACASSPLLSLLATAATSLVVPIARLALRSRGVLTTSTPFGPHLAVGVAAGLVCPLAFGAWLPF